MEILAALWDLAVHLDAHLARFVAEHGAWVYALLFVVIFCETGLVVTPFLPGDSLLFALGALAAGGSHFSLPLVAVTLCLAANCGDLVNYTLGYRIGPKVFSRESSWPSAPSHRSRDQPTPCW